MAKAAEGRDQSSEATHLKTPFLEHLFTRPAGSTLFSDTPFRRDFQTI
jgi:hypothetical protein